MMAKKANNTRFVLHPRNEDIEVHPVDPFNRQRHVPADDLRHILCYHPLGFTMESSDSIQALIDVSGAVFPLISP